MFTERPWLRFINNPTDGTVGGDGADPNGNPPAPTTASDPDAGDQLGEGGKKALDAERAANKDLRAQLKTLQAQVDAAKAKPADGEPEWKQQLDTLKTELATERQAREAAEQEAATTKRVQYGIDKGLPKALAELLIGLDEDKVDAKIDELKPLVKSGPEPNPQQGQPSGSRGGTLAAGREQYAATHK